MAHRVADTEANSASYDFLAPPQEVDELGRLGAYRVLKVLGTGGMGVVFEAEDVQLKRKVALKVMPPSRAASETARKRFLREAQATAAIEHDQIVAIHQVGEDRGLPYLAMQLLKGESLDERLEREPQLPAVEVLRLGREIACGLAAAHQQGLIHRDIKPANIWLEAGDQRVKILDFGLVRAVVDDAQVTQTGMLVGTPAYMSPEQTRNQPMDARSDLFSLGTLLYRMSTGRQPFLASDTIATLLAVATAQPPPPHEWNPDVPRSLSSLIMRLLAKDPNDRPASAQAVVEAIEAIEGAPCAEAPGVREGDDFATLTISPVHRNPPRRRGRQRLWALGIGGASLVALVSLLLGTGLVRTTPRKSNLASGPSPRSDQRSFVKSAPTPALTIPPADPGRADRRAAEWVLKLGGQVEVTPWDGGPGIDVRQLAALPAKPFWVERIRLVAIKQVTDAGLENLAGLTRLHGLWLPETRITDAGLIHVRGLTALQGINLVQTPISDRGLEQLQGLKKLEALYLDGTGVTDRGLRFLKDLARLRELGLRWTQVSDEGLEQLERFGLKNLRTLHLGGTKITDAGVERFQAALPRCQIQR
jgi:serine/threonine protein kinase